MSVDPRFTVLTQVADVWARFGDVTLCDQSTTSGEELLEIRRKARRYLNLVFDSAIAELEALNEPRQ